VALLLSDPRIDSKFRKETRDIAVQGGEKGIIQLFDPEKREIIVLTQGQQKVIDEYKSRISAYEQRRESDQRTIEMAQKKLAEEEAAHKESKEILERLEEEVRTRTVTEHEQRYSDLKVEYEQLLKQNEELTQITELTTIQLDPMWRH